MFIFASLLTLLSVEIITAVCWLMKKENELPMKDWKHLLTQSHICYQCDCDSNRHSDTAAFKCPLPKFEMVPACFSIRLAFHFFRTLLLLAATSHIRLHHVGSVFD